MKHVSAKVTPGAKRERIREVREGRYEISVREEAEHNAANTRVVELLARALGVPAKQVRMIKGHRGSAKVFTIGE